MNFREATTDDLPQLLEIEQRVIEAERSFSASIKEGKTSYYDIEYLITSNNSELIVAEDRGGIIGTGYAQIRNSKASLEHDIHSYMGFMYVSPDYRGKGVNRDILNLLIIWSKRKGAPNIYLEVYTQNIPAIKAYEKVGFEPCLTEMKLQL